MATSDDLRVGVIGACGRGGEAPVAGSMMWWWEKSPVKLVA